MTTNTPLRGNKYMLIILAWQFAVSFSLPLIEAATGLDLLGSQLAIIPLHILLFIVPFALYLRITSQRASDVLQLKKISPVNIILIILMCATIQPLIMVISGLSTLLFPNNASGFISDLRSLPLPVAIAATSLTPAITEEITMRGVILSNYEHVDIKKAAFVNGLLFGVLHLDPQQFLYAFLLGVLFAYFIHYTKSLFASITAHFTINLIQTSLAYLSFNALEQLEQSELIIEQTADADILQAIVFLSVVALIFTPVCIIIYRAFVSHNRQRMVTEALSCDIEDALAQDAMAGALAPSIDSRDKGMRIINWPFVLIIIFFVLFIAAYILIM